MGLGSTPVTPFYLSHPFKGRTSSHILGFWESGLQPMNFGDIIQPGTWLLNTHLGDCRGEGLLCPKSGPCGPCPLWPFPAEGKLPGCRPQNGRGSPGSGSTPPHGPPAPTVKKTRWCRRGPGGPRQTLGQSREDEPWVGPWCGLRLARRGLRVPLAQRLGTDTSSPSPTATGSPVGHRAGPAPHPSADPQGRQEAQGTVLSSPDQEPRVTESSLALQLFLGLTAAPVRKGLSSPSGSAWHPSAPRRTSPGPRGSVVVRGALPMVAGQLCGERPGLGGTGSGDRGLSER